MLGRINMRSEPSALFERSRRLRQVGGCACARGAGHSLFIGHHRAGNTAVTLIELLCVMAIIAILSSLLLPAVLRAYTRIKGAAEELEAEEVAHMLKQETRNYCAAYPRYQFNGKADLADKCVLAPKCRSWVQASTTDFVPFDYLDPTNKIVLSVHLGPKHRTLCQFTKGDLSIRPER